MPETLMELIDVTREFLAGGQRLAVLNGVSLTVQAGRSLAVVGPSGCGKSTLLNIMAALDRPTGGRVVMEGQDISQLSDRRLSEIRRRRIGMVFQMHHLLSQCTALENVLLPTIGLDDPAAAERAAELLRQVGLARRMHHRPEAMSVGERQRVAVARALINGPSLLLADEPTGSLDGRSADAMGQLLVDLAAVNGMAIVLVTHSMALARRMGQVLELRDGQLAQTGATA